MTANATRMPNLEFWTNVLVADDLITAPDESGGLVDGVESVFRCPEGTDAIAPTYPSNGHTSVEGRGWSYHDSFRGPGVSWTANSITADRTGVAVRTWYTPNSWGTMPIDNTGSERRTTEFQRTSHVVLVLDGVWEVFRASAGEGLRISARHGGDTNGGLDARANMTFLDAHVEGVDTTWLYDRAPTGPNGSTDYGSQTAQQSRGVIFRPSWAD